MVQIELNDEEAKVLQNVLENYGTHLRIEIVGTYRKEFRDALRARESVVTQIIEVLRKARGDES